MPQINRSKTTYHKLSEDLQTAKMRDAKIMVSINMTVPKGMESKVDDFMDEAHDSVAKAFHKFMKKRIKKDSKKSSEEG